MAKVKIDINNMRSILDAAARMERTARRLQAEKNKVIKHLEVDLDREVFRPMLEKLTEPPETRQEGDRVRWKTEQQKRLVYKLAKQGVLRVPYIRADDMKRNWIFRLTIQSGRLVGTLRNTNPNQSFPSGLVGNTNRSDTTAEVIKPYVRKANERAAKTLNEWLKGIVKNV